jgi:uncharacterized RDD family membrane protein YckC
VSQLVTGEAVMLHLRPARLPSRVLARALDIGIELVAYWGFGLALGTVAFADGEFALALNIVLSVLFVVGYPVVFESLWRGQTPGKAALGLRVVRDDGGPVRFRHALTRGLFNIVDLWLSFGSVGMISSLLSRRGKRLGDVIAGTFVIQERVPRQHVAPIYMPPQLAAWAATLDLSRLPDDLALAVRGFLGRSTQLRPDARERLGAELAAAVSACVTPAPPPGTPGWAYLAAVVAERRRRDEARRPAAGTYQPSPWQPAAPSPGWGPSPPRPAWAESAPPTGSPPTLGPPPAVGPPPADPGPPRLPAAPSPQWGPPPVPPSPPPGAPSGSPAGAQASAGARTATADAVPAHTPQAAPEDGFALPG